jgi:hypothetical protein
MAIQCSVKMGRIWSDEGKIQESLLFCQDGDFRGGTGSHQADLSLKRIIYLTHKK